MFFLSGGSRLRESRCYKADIGRTPALSADCELEKTVARRPLRMSAMRAATAAFRFVIGRQLRAASASRLECPLKLCCAASKACNEPNPVIDFFRRVRAQRKICCRCTVRNAARQRTSLPFLHRAARIFRTTHRLRTKRTCASMEISGASSARNRGEPFTTI